MYVAETTWFSWYLTEVLAGLVPPCAEQIASKREAIHLFDDSADEIIDVLVVYESVWFSQYDKAPSTDNCFHSTQSTARFGKGFTASRKITCVWWLTLRWYYLYWILFSIISYTTAVNQIEISESKESRFELEKAEPENEDEKETARLCYQYHLDVRQFVDRQPQPVYLHTNPKPMACFFGNMHMDRSCLDIMKR